MTSFSCESSHHAGLLERLRGPDVNLGQAGVDGGEHGQALGVMDLQVLAIFITFSFMVLVFLVILFFTCFL